MRFYCLLPRSLAPVDGSSVSGAGWGALVLAFGLPLESWANPQGVTVVSGTATVTTAGPRTDITVGQTTVLNWSSFNIGPGETTAFHQPSANSVALNWIGDAQASQIYGNLTANGRLILANAHGFYFGPDSYVSIGGSLVLTTTQLPPDSAGGTGWQFTGPPPGAAIVNYGRIEAHHGGSLFVIADKIENHGMLSAPEGQIGLYAGKEVLLSTRPDGRGVSVQVRLPTGCVNNTGSIIADAGEIALHARTVNQDGVIQANSVRTKAGVVELVADDTLSLGAASDIRATGDGTTGSNGGTVTLKSGNSFEDTVGSRIDATGGAGGTIEWSAPSIQSLQSTLAGGHWLLDPTDIVLTSSGTGSVDANGGVAVGDPPTTLSLNPATAFKNKQFTDITLEATHDIRLSAGLTWDLSGSTGISTGDHQLSLIAGNNIQFQNNSKLTDGNHWSVSLEAGYDFTAGKVQAGNGSILLNGSSGTGIGNNATIVTAEGNVKMIVGKDILVGTGSVGTVKGGSVNLVALSGNIDAGTKNDGYNYTVTGYSVGNNVLGGITTAHGGDVTLVAGGDVTSIPKTPLNQTPGASGAYGVEPGNVTVMSGGNITGNFLVRNGTGILKAGVDLTDPGHPVAVNPGSQIGTKMAVVNLSLISGSWSVWSGGDINVGEIRNPNGTFNPNRLKLPIGQFIGNTGDSGTVPTKSAFLFDYAADAAAKLWAGHEIDLLGDNLTRIHGLNQGMPPVYPSNLSLDAGSGGIFVKNSIVLYPSSQGSLTLRTRDGGDWSGATVAGGLVSITESDSGLPDYTTFATGHALVPLHLNDPVPATLDISGNINSVALAVPTRASVHVSGSAYNFGFTGQNLHPGDVSRIQVDGTISYRGNLTGATLSDPFPADALNTDLSPSPLITQKLSYSATTQQLTWIGQMTSADLQYLLTPQRYLFDAYGRPILNPDGSQKTETIPLSPAQMLAIQSLYTDSQSASLGDQGIALSGPGQFQIQAARVDLGVSAGIFVTTSTPALEAISPASASLEVDVVGRAAAAGVPAIAGDLVMTATRISNEGWGGSITVNAAGSIDIGTQQTALGAGSQPRGIYTTGGGNISLQATGDIEVDGSRVAAYDGGNILIHSSQGDVNAGSGGTGGVTFVGTEWDPVNQVPVHFPATIPGSGILSTTLAGGTVTLGSVDIEAPNGSIRANTGGVIQIAFNGTTGGRVSLTAGKDIESGFSGIIGGDIRLKAGGSVSGIVVGTGNVNIVSDHGVNVSVLSGGSVAISAGTTVSGTVIGGGTIDVSGASITAALVGKSVATSGDASGASVGVPASTAVRADSQVAESGSSLAGRLRDEDQDKNQARKGSTRALLTRTVGRVSVLLPSKTTSN